MQNICYTGNPVQIFSAATDEELLDTEFLIQTTDKFYEANQTWKRDMKGKTKKLFEFINSHSRQTRYTMEIFKCGIKGCAMCKPIRMPMNIWNEIIHRPKFIPMPEPVVDNIVEQNKKNMKFKSYAELKNKSTEEIYRPSFVATIKYENATLSLWKEFDQYINDTIKSAHGNKVPTKL